MDQHRRQWLLHEAGSLYAVAIGGPLPAAAIAPSACVRWRVAVGYRLRWENSSRMTANSQHDPAGDRKWSRLMAAAQDGDRVAYDQLLRQILPFIRAIAARQHRAPDRIEDVVQEVLLTIHRVRHTYDPTRPFSHWLAAIARRRSIDLLRRRGRIEGIEILNTPAYETFADPGANREKEAGDAAAALGRAMSGLPQRQREAIELVKVRELSLADASRLTGRSVGALKVNVHRALKVLRTRLSGE
jgi:RNA polymerase sigma factor (sigma-70 family)